MQELHWLMRGRDPKLTLESKEFMVESSRNMLSINMRDVK